MDDFLSEKVQEHGIARFGKKERACNRLDYRLLLADRVGFEPTSRLRDYLISSQGRYDHFDTYPWTRFTNARMIITNPAKKIKYGGGISANSVV